MRAAACFARSPSGYIARYCRKNSCANPSFPSICEYCYTNREFFRRAIQIEGQNSPRAYWKKSLIPLIHRDFAGSAFDDAIVDFYIERETDALFDYMQIWIKNEPCQPPDEFAAQVRSSVYNHARHVAEVAGRKPPDVN